MTLADFDALSFDCYGTLIDWEAGMLAVLAPWAEEHQLDVDDEALLAAYAAHETEAEAELPSALYPDIVGSSFRALGEQLGTFVSQHEAQRLAISVPEWPAFDDSHDALVALGKRHQLIVLSNVDRASFAGSNRRLDVRFDKILTAQDVGAYKPSPRSFEVLLETARAMEVAEGRLLHVAQSLFHDHVPAQAAGLPTVWINRRHARGGWGATPPPPTEVTPNWEFPSMAAFAQAVAADNAG